MNAISQWSTITPTKAELPARNAPTLDAFFEPRTERALPMTTCPTCGCSHYLDNLCADCLSLQTEDDYAWQHMTAWDRHHDEIEIALERAEYNGSPLLVFPNIVEYRGKKVGKAPLRIGIGKARQLVKWHTDIYAYAMSDSEKRADLPHNPDNTIAAALPHIYPFAARGGKELKYALNLPKEGKPFGFGQGKAVIFAQYIDQIIAFVNECDQPAASVEPATVYLLPATCPTAHYPTRVTVIASGPTLYLPADIDALNYQMSVALAEMQSVPLLPAGEPVKHSAPVRRDVVVMDPVQLPLLETSRGVQLPLIRTELTPDELPATSTTRIPPLPSAAEIEARAHDDVTDAQRRYELSLCRECGTFTCVNEDDDGAGYTCEDCQETTQDEAG